MQYQKGGKPSSPLLLEPCTEGTDLPPAVISSRGTLDSSLNIDPGWHWVVCFAALGTV